MEHGYHYNTNRYRPYAIIVFLYNVFDIDYIWFDI